MKNAQSILVFLRCFMVALAVLFLISALSYWLHVRVDLVDRHLLWSDFFKIIFSGGFNLAGQVFLCAMVFSLAWLSARKRIKRFTISLSVLLILSAVFGFYLVGYLVPQANLYNYSMHFSLLEKGDANYQSLQTKNELFDDAYGCSNYSDLGRIISTVEADMDSVWNRKLKLIRNLADPRNVQMLLDSDKYGRMFSPENFAGVTSKYEGFNLENAQMNIEDIARLMQQEREMREVMIFKYQTAQKGMLLYPFHFLLFCLMAFFAGKLLMEIPFAPQLVMVILLIVPVPAFTMSFFAGQVAAQWIGLFLELFILLIIYRVSEKIKA